MSDKRALAVSLRNPLPFMERVHNPQDAPAPIKHESGKDMTQEVLAQGLRREMPTPVPKSLSQKFNEAIAKARSSEEEMAEEFAPDDFRYGETKRGEDSPTGEAKIYINRRKLEDAGATEGYMNQMLQGEGLHLLKDIAPDRHQRIVDAALSEPSVMEWARKSYEREGDERPFDEWFINSRLDQVIGGYFFGGKDSSIPTMRNWDKEQLPYGEKFRQELDQLGSDLGL